MIASQIEFPLAVAVCAWCKPRDQGALAGSLSHGICLRHLKKMKLEARGLPAKRPRVAGRGGMRELSSKGLLLAL
jgi:hypothetical protein